MIFNSTRRPANAACFAVALLAMALPGATLAATGPAAPGFADAMRHIEAEGFRIVEADLDDDAYEVEAYDRSGQKVELHVDRNDLRILRREVEK